MEHLCGEYFIIMTPKICINPLILEASINFKCQITSMEVHLYIHIPVFEFEE